MPSAMTHSKNPCPLCTSRRPVAAAQRGVTLIELLVGVAIGLMATLVITQVAVVYEGQKRTTTSGSDAQVNGTLALQTLQREIQSSGYGLTSSGLLGCTEIRGGYDSTPFVNIFEADEDGASATGVPMSPVMITDGSGGLAAGGASGVTTSGQPDRLRILASNNPNVSLPQRVKNEHTRTDTRFDLDDNTNVGNSVGDLMLSVPPAIDGSWCSLFVFSRLTTKNVDGTDVPSEEIWHEIDSVSGATWHWNPDATSTVFPTKTSAGAFLINLGSLKSAQTNLRYRSYEINLDRAALQMRSYNAITGKVEAAVELFPNIVSLQMTYGIDTKATPTNQADTWSNKLPTQVVGGVTVTQWRRIVAMRLAVVARSAQPEKETVTPSMPQWSPDGVNKSFIPVNLDGRVSNWKNYRYKVFETVVPLRNILWQS